MEKFTLFIHAIWYQIQEQHKIYANHKMILSSLVNICIFFFLYSWRPLSVWKWCSGVTHTIGQLFPICNSQSQWDWFLWWKFIHHHTDFMPIQCIVLFDLNVNIDFINEMIFTDHSEFAIQFEKVHLKERNQETSKHTPTEFMCIKWIVIILKVQPCFVLLFFCYFSWKYRQFIVPYLWWIHSNWCVKKTNLTCILWS